MPGIALPPLRVHHLSCRLRYGEAKCVCPFSDVRRILEFWTNAENKNEAIANTIERYPKIKVNKEIDTVVRGLAPETEEFLLKHKVF